jgi:hypothetical protein
VLKYLLIILFGLFGLAIPSWGQYYGGNAAGSAILKISATACPTNIDNSVLIYMGGNAGGTAKLSISNTACIFGLDESVLIYKGGNAGGTSKLSISNTVCTFGLDESVLIYKGGNAGGTGILGIASTSCPIPDLMNIFLGGVSSSNAVSVLSATTTSNTSGPYIATINDTTIVNGNCISLNTFGTGATTYSWSPSTGLSNANIQNPVASPNATTTYTVTALGSSTGCRNTAQVTINVLGNNSVTSLTYPTKVCNTNTTLQEPTITGITNGTFSASSTGLKMNTSSGLINPSTSTVGTYVVTYTYGSCNNTITANIEITNDCSTNIGALDYQNIFRGGVESAYNSKYILTQGACYPNYDYTQLIYAGGVESLYNPKNTLTQAACTPNYDFTQLIYAGGNGSTLTPKSLLTQAACTPNLDFTKLIYVGGSNESNTPKSILLQGVCSVPVGNNFYIGGDGAGYGNGSLTPSASAVTGTAVAAGADVTVCPGTPTTLGATGATSYTWTPATGLNNSLLANPIASPTTTTTYTVVGTGTGVGCINTAKVTVNVIQDAFTTVSYGAYNFDEADMSLKKVNYINGPLNGTYSFTPTGLSFNSADGSFTPGLSTSQAYTINYNYTKGICSYTYGVNINITKLPPNIRYTTPTVFYINYSNVALSPTNSGGSADIFESLDPLPAGLNLNTTTGEITGTPTQLVNNASVRLRAANYKRDGSINWSDITTMVISVKKPTITLAVSTIPSLNTTYGSASTNASFNVQGDNIIDYVLVVAPTGFESSVVQGSGFADTIKMYPTADHLINQPLYVRLKKTAPVGNHNGNVLLTSTSADDVAVTATTSYVAPATLTITARYFQKFFGSSIRLGTGSRYFNTTGLVNNETVGSVTITASGGTGTTDAVGYYTIIPSAPTGGTFSSSNYNINYVAGQFQVVYSLYNFAMTGNTSNWVGGKVPIPKISSGRISNLQYNSATYATYISPAFVNIDQRGVCYGTSPNPTIADNIITDANITTGNLSFSLTNLTSLTTYYVRTFVTVGNKTVYSSNYKFRTPQKPVSSILLSTSSQYLSFPKLASMNASGDFTFETWIKFNTIAAGAMDPIFAGGQYDYFSIYNAVATRIEANGACSGDKNLAATSTISTGSWHHLALVRSNTVITFYLDGVATGTTVTCNGTFLNSLSTMYIGKNIWKSGNLNAYITNMRYVVGTAVYTSNFTPPTTLLTAIPGTQFLLTVDDAANPYKDSSPNNLTISAFGTPVIYQTGGPF